MKLKFSDFSSFFFYYCFFFLNIIFSELTVRSMTIGLAGRFPYFIILFAASLAAIPAIICGALNKKARSVLSYIFCAIIALIMCVQLVYHGFCGSFMQVAQLAMGGDAMTAFGDAMWLEILESSLGIILMFVPTIFLVLLKKLNLGCGEKTPLRLVLCEVILFFVMHFGAVMCLPIFGKAMFSHYSIYHDTFILEKSIKHFGILTSLRLDIRNLFFGSSGELVMTSNGQVLQNAEGANITDINFDKLIKNEENAEIKELHKYFSNATPTEKNEYTGMFEGYNLVLICAESFSHHLLKEDLMPTLYKMATEGFVFTDYYNTVSDNTSNGEYALLSGLIPDTTLLGEGWKTFYNYNSFTTSKDNYIPFALGTQYIIRGANSFAVHNHTASYYGRNKTHPNMGYEFLAFGKGLKQVETYPTSDLSMMEQTLPRLLEKNADGTIKPFHAYFLTFSGHMPYVFDEEHNDMCVKNKSYTDKLTYSSRLRAYISCQLELEFAVKYLIDEFEKAGVLDKTLFVITNDHYPYPLDAVNKDGSLKYLSELAGYTLDNHIDKYRSGLVMWSASMKNPVVVDSPTCSLDVLPTLSNLLGFTYDSRLMAGKDALSSVEHIAILADRSFITDKVIFDAESETVILRDGTKLPEGYLERINTEVQNRFNFSNKILYNDYYRVVYK